MFLGKLRSLRAGLSAISLLASFLLAQKCPLSVVRCLLSENARKGCRCNP